MNHADAKQALVIRIVKERGLAKKQAYLYRLTREDGRPFNLVMAREINETTADYVREAREAAGMRILLSDSSVYGPFNMLRARSQAKNVKLRDIAAEVTRTGTLDQ